ncbi:MAG: MFS transporter [Polyangiaceae bacterium]
MRIKAPVAILALLTALNLLNYMDRLVVSAVLTQIQDALDMHSDRDAGLLATVFLVGYFATSPFFGTLGDRGKRTRLIALGILIWSVATIASGLAHDKLQLFVARAFVGVGEASYATIAPTIIDDLAPPGKKGKWLAVFYAAMPVGAALGYVVGGSVGSHHGWNAAFFVAGAPGLVLALVMLLVDEPARKTTAVRESALAATRSLLPFKLYWRSVFGYAAFTFAMGGFAYWAPKYLIKTYGLTLDIANGRFGTITVITGFVGAFVGGWLGDRAAKKDNGGQSADLNAALGYLRVCAWTTLIGAPLALLAIVASTPNGFFAWTFPTEIFLFMSSSPINAVILRSVPEERRASAMAVSIFTIHILGDMWSPPLIGAVTDATSMPKAMLIIPFAFLVAGLLWVVRKPPTRAMTTA